MQRRESKRQYRKDTMTRVDQSQTQQQPNSATNCGGDDGEGGIESSSYGQTMPITMMGEMMGGGHDAPVMPIHFQYNFLNREDMPLHNERYSKPSIMLESQQRNATTFFDNTLDIPSHVVLNHVNTWKEQNEQMTVVSMTQRLNKTKFITTIYYKPNSTFYEDEDAPQGGFEMPANATATTMQ